ncbi:MAG TPA: 3-hydroxyacyl-CoA dehydrogenase family protein [Baekduia sp.]|nr:3-hydroxyacyl-CoA dehydrogenase family protein [Baekduia sp.]
MHERLGIAGSGRIACGLAAVAAPHGEVVLWARSSDAAERARVSVHTLCGRLGGEVDAARVRVETDLEALGEATAVVEAVREDEAVKSGVLADVGRVTGDDAILATTTSSLSVERLARASGAPERFVGLHVFNPVPKMKLVELAFPTAATDATRRRVHDMCELLGKTAVEVPDLPGFVVNRLLFPYLFSAVVFLEDTGMEPADVDLCMTLGAGHPMGPLALLDYVGLDVAVAIGDAIGAEVPARLRALVAEGALGRKSGRGLYNHD